MKMEEYLDKVTEQIRCKKARASVAGELENHILDQMEAYKQEGLNEEDALDKAIIEMGDPVEVGVSFDRIHRPQMSWGMLILVGFISIFSILLQLAFRSEGTEYISYMAERQIFFIIFGYICMCLVYYLDYTSIGKYATWIGGAFLLFMIASKPFRLGINGSESFINIGTIAFSIPLAMCLFIPVFGAILFQYRGEGYKAIAKAVMWMAVAVVVLLGVSLPYAFLLGFSMLGLFMVAVWKGWFAVNKKAVLGATASIITLVAIITVAATGIVLKLGILKTYQSDRIKAFIMQDNEKNYAANMAASILGKSSLVGGSKEVIDLANYNLPGSNSELVFVRIVACFGILAGILVTGLLVFMIQKIFRISFGQKNQLGMIIGCGCGMVLFMLTFFSIAQSLGLIPITAVVLPFFSNSGSGTIVFYVLLGLVLSIYRYQNIPMTKMQHKRKRFKIIVE